MKSNSLIDDCKLEATENNFISISNRATINNEMKPKFISNLNREFTVNSKKSRNKEKPKLLISPPEEYFPGEKSCANDFNSERYPKSQPNRNTQYSLLPNKGFQDCVRFRSFAKTEDKEHKKKQEKVLDRIAENMRFFSDRDSDKFIEKEYLNNHKFVGRKDIVHVYFYEETSNGFNILI